MKFSYTALRSDNQKLTGILDAMSLEAAREELHKMGVSVIALEEIATQTPTQVRVTSEAKTQTPQGIGTYYFVANDPQGKEVNGTIDSKDALAAYKRLVTEYQFHVLDLYDQADPQKNSLKSQFTQWNEGLGQTIVQKTASQTGVKEELEDEGEKMAEEIVQEIDHFILNTKKILDEHRSQYSSKFLEEIEKTLNNLERIRTSNNLKHITKVCNDLYALISHPDLQGQVDQEMEGNDYKNIVTNLKESGFIQNKFNLLESRNLEKKAASFEKVQGLFSKIQKKLSGNDLAKMQRSLNGKKEGFFSKLISDLSGSGESLGSKYFAFLLEKNPILRRAKKQAFEMARQEKRANKVAKKLEASEVALGQRQAKSARDFSNFFMELDSFVGWLLFFYLIYFFLASFSIERGFGLPREMVFKTLSSPLILNISILLLIAHLAFTLKIRYFQRNFLGSAFLLFLCFGVYALMMANL